MNATFRPPTIQGAPISGPKILSVLLQLVNELDQLAPNLERQFALSLVTNVPDLQSDDLRTLAGQVLRDARRWRINPSIAQLAAQLTTALEHFPNLDPLYA